MNVVVCGVDLLLAVMKILGCGIFIEREVSIVVILVICKVNMVYCCCCGRFFLEEEHKLDVVFAKESNIL